MTTAFDRWLCLQTNRYVANGVLELAERLGMTDAAEWAARVLAQSPSEDIPTVLRTAQMIALGMHLASPHATTALSIQDIPALRLLANAHSRGSPLVSSNTDANPKPVDTRATGALTGRSQSRPAASEPDAQELRARVFLGREIDKMYDDIPEAAGKLKVELDHWTSRVGTDPEAPDKARVAQEALNKVMAPLRAEAAIGKLNYERRIELEMRLIGGPTLTQVAVFEQERGAPVTSDSLWRIVSILQPERLLPQLPGKDSGNQGRSVDPNIFYELRYESRAELRRRLPDALEFAGSLPIQIRTVDGSRRLDIERGRDGIKITDRGSGMELPQTSDPAKAIIVALGIGDGAYGALVVSYGSSVTATDHPTIYPDPGKVLRERAAELKQTLEQRWAGVDAAYTALVRKLDTAELTTGSEMRLKAEAADVSDEFFSFRNRFFRLENDWPTGIGDRQELERAASLLIDLQRRGLFFEALSVASGERTPNPAPGQSVTERRLATIRDLMRKTPDLPEKLRGPWGEVKLLETVLIQFQRITTDRSMIEEGVLTAEQHEESFGSLSRYFEFLRQTPTAWKRVVESTRLPN